MDLKKDGRWEAVAKLIKFKQITNFPNLFVLIPKSVITSKIGIKM